MLYLQGMHNLELTNPRKERDRNHTLLLEISESIYFIEVVTKRPISR